jgi:hypothetical protein
MYKTLILLVVRCMGAKLGLSLWGRNWVLVGRPKGKRSLGRPRCRWEDNIELDLREIGIDGANWVRLAQDRAQWRAFVNEPLGSIRKQDIFDEVSDY